MKRRTFLELFGGLAVMHREAMAQPKAKHLIGIIGEGFPDDPAIALNLAMFRRGLRQEGFIEGQNVEIVYKWAHNQPDFVQKLAAELVALPIEVLVNEGGTITALAAKKATSSIPIVFHASNALDDGLVDNLAHPGGNLTGVSLFATDADEGIPASDGDGPRGEVGRASLDGTSSHGHCKGGSGNSSGQWSEGPTNICRDRSRTRSGICSIGPDEICRDCIRQRELRQKARGTGQPLPRAGHLQPTSICGGGRPSQLRGKHSRRLCHQGSLHGRILKGAKPSDLPVQQASKFELALNLKTAEVLDLRVPQTILLAADEVLE
jgi:putative tryptophan/tyrosine transport system substrate-binding protein